MDEKEPGLKFTGCDFERELRPFTFGNMGVPIPTSFLTLLDTNLSLRLSENLGNKRIPISFSSSFFTRGTQRTG